MDSIFGRFFDTPAVYQNGQKSASQILVGNLLLLNLTRAPGRACGLLGFEHPGVREREASPPRQAMLLASRGRA